MKNSIVLLVFFIFSCASPQKNFDKGNFTKAYRGALNELEDGKRGKNVTILNGSFNEMLESHHTDYILLMRDADIQDWETAYRKSDNLIVEYLKGERWLDNDFKSAIDIISNENDILLSDIATEYEIMGNESMSQYERTGDKILAQNAFGFYNKLAEYDQDNVNLQNYLNQSLSAGTIHILFDVEAWDFKYEWDIDRKFKDIEKESDGFVQVYFEENIPTVDCLIEVDFNNLDISTRNSTNTEDFRQEIQDGYESKQDTSGVVTKIPVYKSISGAVSITTEIKEYIWEVRVKSNLNTNYCDLRSKNFESIFSTERKSYVLSGDERAIPNEYKNKEDEKFRDDEDDIIDDLIDDIFDQITKYYF